MYKCLISFNQIRTKYILLLTSIYMSITGCNLLQVLNVDKFADILGF